MVLTWSEHNYCAWFEGTVCEQPALVYYGSQSHFHWCGVSSPNRNLFYHVCKFEIHSLNLNFRYMATHKHTHTSSNAVMLVWGSLRLTPLKNQHWSWNIPQYFCWAQASLPKIVYDTAKSYMYETANKKHCLASKLAYKQLSEPNTCGF